MTMKSKDVLLATPRFDVLQIKAADPRYQSDFYIEKLDGVSVAAISGSSVTMLEIERRGQSGLSREFPGGRIERGENAFMAARRELSEEVALVCDDLKYVGWIAPLPGLVSERVHMFVAPILPEDAACARAQVGHEGIQRHCMIKISELPTHCAVGRISSAVDAYFALRLALQESDCKSGSLLRTSLARDAIDAATASTDGHKIV
jgi:8-oxo-dGTP pyrophosphatase MutT (NUDIX family)